MAFAPVPAAAWAAPPAPAPAAAPPRTVDECVADARNTALQAHALSTVAQRAARDGDNAEWLARAQGSWDRANASVCMAFDAFDAMTG